MLFTFMDWDSKEEGFILVVQCPNGREFQSAKNKDKGLHICDMAENIEYNQSKILLLTTVNNNKSQFTPNKQRLQEHCNIE